jgi:DNA-binding GntR family transcriptional regulator
VERVVGKLEPSDSQCLYFKVYHALRQAVISGILEPGERIVERKLAKQLGVSRTPVREALRQLELEGLVKHTPNKGVIVSRMSAKDVWDVYNIRAVLEGLAARLAAQSITPEEIADLEMLFQEMEKAAAEKDMEHLNELHLDFNEIIYRAARNTRLHQMISDLVDYIISFTKIGYTVPGRVHEATEEHKALLEAIKSGDADQAEMIGRKHIERSCKAYFIQLALDEKGR